MLSTEVASNRGLFVRVLDPCCDGVECNSGLTNGVGRPNIEIVDEMTSICSMFVRSVLLCFLVSCLCLWVSLHGRSARRLLRASGKQRLIILSSSPWMATQRLVTCCGLRSIATPTDVLDVEKVPVRGIPDGRRGERIAGASCWTRAVPAPTKKSIGRSGAV